MEPLLHRNFKRDRSLVLKLAGAAEPGSFIFPVGTSGVGKTVMEPWIIRKLAGDPERWRTGTLPAIVARASRAEKGFFSSKDFQTRLNLALQSPDFDWLDNSNDVDRRALCQLREDQVESGKVWSHLKLHASERELRVAFERQSVAREVKWVFVRDGASICGTQKGKDPSDYILSCMEIAEQTRTVWVIFGVARMAKLWQTHGEVRRRSTVIPLMRYFDVEDDDIAFAQVVRTVARQYKFSSPDLVQNNVGLVYATTAGSYGQVKAFFARAWSRALLSGSDVVNQNHLSSAVYGEEDLKTLWADTREFDRLLVPGDTRRVVESSPTGWK